MLKVNAVLSRQASHRNLLLRSGSLSYVVDVSAPCRYVWTYIERIRYVSRSLQMYLLMHVFFSTSGGTADSLTLAELRVCMSQRSNPSSSLGRRTPGSLSSTRVSRQRRLISFFRSARSSFVCSGVMTTWPLLWFLPAWRPPPRANLRNCTGIHQGEALDASSFLRP